MNNMGRGDNFGEGFGVSRQEEVEMSGRALGAHVWDQIMTPFGGEGGYRKAVQSEAYDRMRESGYGAEHIKIDNDGEGSAYVEHQSGPYRARWFGGTYADIHHVSDPGAAIDTLNIGHQAHPDKGTELQKSLDSWHEEVGKHYH
jgi:hypothetical protein